ncbi:uncharacterized protein LOC141596117 [Silene latifolia]|uniref:uncharacterized protein LOC141596117 n=1 Tax=Silene latifolia TaxID=37657 RepID=UPI003D782698
MAFFKSMALKATQGEKPYKYLSVIINDTETQGYLEYSADEVHSPNAKFAVEYAHGGLVHIRSCRTNKYWVRSSSEGYWIVAKASEPMDDKSAWNCTLFRMDLISDDNKATFYHVQSETVLRIRNDDSDRKMFLCIDPSTTSEAISVAVDLDTMPLLPKYIALKADNGKFLDYGNSNFTSDDYCNSKFTSDDYGKDGVVNEISTTTDGYTQIKQKGTPGIDVVWCCRPMFDSIFMTRLPVPDEEQTYFEVVRVKDGVVAIRSIYNGNFCRRCGPEISEPDILDVSATSIIKEAQFQVVETVFSRSVQVLDFDLDNSRIYNLTPISSATYTYQNPTAEVQEATMEFQISTTKTSTWNNNISVGGGVETSFTTGIPLIAEGKITVSAEASYSHEFGGSIEETQQVVDTYTVKVPPFTIVTGRGMATKGTCDVPFTYSQVDHLTDGTTIRRTLADGVFTGVNAYNFYHDVHYEDIPEELKLKFSQLTTSAD